MTNQSKITKAYALADRYDLMSGRVFLTGTQALARIALDQARRDHADGLNTAGFISGYRGSPLAGLDRELWANRARLDAHGIRFAPAINEDLGAAAVLGAQQATLDPDCTVEGVFSIWYGKGPGVDRSGDALRHGNAYGSAPKGGVLVIAGDDHGCVSSSMPHQSDVAFMSWFMPTLNPACVAEYLRFGEYGIALSRYSGTWVGFKAISETVESAQSIDLVPPRMFEQPDFKVPLGGLHVRPLDLPSVEIETRMEAKLEAVEAFVEANPIDRVEYGVDGAKYGIVTTGKAYLDLREALRLLGLDDTACRRLGIDIYKVGMVWPLAKRDALGFVSDKHEVLVIEEKRGIIESQLKEYFYDWPGQKPHRMVGKYDENLEPLIPWTGELSPRALLPVLAKRLDAIFPDAGLQERAAKLLAEKGPTLFVPGALRTPFFCSGCPHNTSTKVPQGSQASSGIGCHVMASWMNRETGGYTHMGAEGVPASISDQYSGNKHRFQNIGDGTWYHSGALAIRQALALKANITYKILYNDAVAMTGGQPVDGMIDPQGIAHACRAEGITRIALVSDDIGKFTHADFPPDTTFHDRKDLDPVQRELREIPGVTILIYEQTCATEKRRRRKRGLEEDPKRFAVINEMVCEGCGDCSVESNCLSVEPMQTEFGTKRKINLSNCNKDFSCLNGFCPSFVTIEGGVRKKKESASLDPARLASELPTPDLPSLSEPYDLLVTGVGGTGVVTVGALITMAAHLEGKGSSVLDFTGFAQKFGTVLSYIRLGKRPDAIHQVRTEEASADAVIGCDAVVSSGPKASVYYGPQTRMVLNEAEMPTGDLILKRDASLKIPQRRDLIAETLGNDRLWAFDANAIAEELLGDGVFANILMLGYAWQRGLVPVSLNALMQAIELNGVVPEKNQQAFNLGRVHAHAPDRLALRTEDNDTPSATQLIERRKAFLTDYQNVAYARRFEATLQKFSASVPEANREAWLTLATASLFKLMAYKDEYEVARLHMRTEFQARLADEFEPGFKINFHLSPPILPLGSDARGRPNKRSFGPWLVPAFRLLARFKWLRGTRLDPFGWQADRKLERDLITWFEDILERLARVHLTDEQVEIILSGPMDIRGYGPVKEASAATVKSAIRKLLSPN